MKEGIEKVTKKMESSKDKGEDVVIKVKDGESKTNDKDVKTKYKDVKITEPPKKKGKEFKPPTKVVVRRLPPSMTEEEFLQQIDPLPPVDFMYYVLADNSLSPNNFCRAYLNFVNQADIFIFTQKFDNYVFVDSKGNEYPAVVEFAPFQRIPKQRQNKKKDTKSGTLSSDPFYISFLEKLETEAQEMSSANNNAKQHFFETNVDSNAVTKVSSTPLLDFLHNKYQERRRVREEKRKKDLERKKAKDEIKKAAKKDEEAPSAVKVLHGNAASKDKLKDKENSRPTANKKRNDERVRENKIRVGKSYQEEKQRQLEKREEQNRKLGLSKSQKSSNDDKKEEDRVTKDNEDNDGEDGDIGNGSKVTEEVQEDKKDRSSSEKSTSSQKKQYTSGQAYQEYQEAQRAKRDEERRRYREERALKRKEERLRSKKAAGAERKNYDNNDRYKERSSSGSFKGPPSNSYGMDRKAKNSKMSRSDDAIDRKKQSEENAESTKPNVRARNESFGEDIDKQVEETSGKSCEKDITLNKTNECNSSSRFDASDSCISNQGTSKFSNIIAKGDVNNKDVKEKGDSNTEESSRSDLNADEPSVSCERVVSFGADADDLIGDSINNKDTKTTSFERNERDKGIARDSSSKLELNRLNSSIDRDDDDDNGEINSESLDKEKPHEENREICDDDDTAIKNEACDTELGINDEQNQTHEKVTGFLSNEDKKEECIKRRNSMEMYTDGKEENSEKHKRRESGRRNSLESGDQNLSLKSLGECRDQGKESGDSKERLKDQGGDPRTKRRIRNKDRPSMEIYRPGMGRFSKQRLERDKVGSSTEVDSPSPSPSPTPIPKLRHSNSNSSSQGRAT